MPAHFGARRPARVVDVDHFTEPANIVGRAVLGLGHESKGDRIGVNNDGKTSDFRVADKASKTVHDSLLLGGHGAHQPLPHAVQACVM